MNERYLNVLHDIRVALFFPVVRLHEWSMKNVLTDSSFTEKWYDMMHMIPLSEQSPVTWRDTHSVPGTPASHPQEWLEASRAFLADTAANHPFLLTPTPDGSFPPDDDLGYWQFYFTQDYVINGYVHNTGWWALSQNFCESYNREALDEIAGYWKITDHPTHIAVPEPVPGSN